MSDTLPIPIANLRGIPVMIGAELALIHGVPTKQLNQAVRRNAERFPEDFCFQLTPDEKAGVVANCDHLENLKFFKALPHAFTEHGALMAANVLGSPNTVHRFYPRIRHPAVAELWVISHLVPIGQPIVGPLDITCILSLYIEAEAYKQKLKGG